MRALAIAVISCVIGCGGGDEPSTANRGASTPAPAANASAPPAGAGSGSALVPMMRAESRVDCPVPAKGSKSCDPNAPRPVQIGGVKDPNAPATPDLSCPEDQFCLPTSEGFLCGRCDERLSLRAQFKDRDFVAEANRDPFQSFIIKTPGQSNSTDKTTNSTPIDAGSRCQRPDQLVAQNYGFQDLKLVGIVAQGTQRKVLMMDPSNYGRIIRRGDCVGKEKAWVKDIGDNFVCFEVVQNDRPTNQHCVELHSKTVASQLPTESPTNPPPPRTPNTPNTAPPSTQPQRDGALQPPAMPPSQGAPGTTTIKPVTP
ncbi:MAG TPA: pilus assembly protein PilP [Kofleriaceae bacterium]|nr:pilus assembly protein PilP [Kofleriaceae bacterium]